MTRSHLATPACASRSSMRRTTSCRLSAFCMGPICAAPMRKMRLMILAFDDLVHRGVATAPISSGAHPFRIGAMVGNQLLAQPLGGERLACDPGVVVAGREFDRRQRA